MFDLDQAIVEWRRQMSAAGIKSPVPLEELEIHLREDIENQMRSGVNAPQAFDRAVLRIGGSGALKSEFAKAGRTSRARFRKHLLPALGIGLGLFLAGASFCFLVMLPLALVASRQYASWMGFEVPPSATAANVGFVCRFMLGMGCAFAMPAGLLLLVRTGILDRQKMAGGRRYVIVLNLVLAVLTTPELVTQILLFIVLQLCYEASVWISCHWERKPGHG